MRFLNPCLAGSWLFFGGNSFPERMNETNPVHSRQILRSTKNIVVRAHGVTSAIFLLRQQFLHHARRLDPNQPLVEPLELKREPQRIESQEM